ncbi:MAG: ribonuclease H family protein [Bacteroidaceae bacterium]|nr:ribonuclease H family protein [Bacteroidaceae bacterium]
MAGQKFYVVWIGASPGIYLTWDECQQQVAGWKGAIYKAFDSMEEAQKAYGGNPDDYFEKKAPAKRGRAASKKKEPKALPPEIIPYALAVDAACSGNPGQMEYRGIYLAEMKEVFHYGPAFGTNNIGEFLAIVHGLSLLKQKGLDDWPIYSDSHNAIIWVKQKKCKTKLERTPKTEALFQVIERAERWLAQNTYRNPIIKWETSRLGEIPADFGRK